MIVAAALIALVPSAAAQQEVQQPGSPGPAHVRAAEELLGAGRSAEALAEAEKALAEDENLAAAWFAAGLALGQLGRDAEARDHFVRATELQPGWGEAHRFASMASADVGDLEASWDHAIKAQQAGTDMSDAFAGLQAMSRAPDNLDTWLTAARVFVGGFDATPFERGGTNTVAKAILSITAADRFAILQEFRRQFAASRYFGLVERQEQARYLMVIEIDAMNARRMTGVLRLVDALSAEEAYRRRIDFTDITSTSYLARELHRIVGLMETWAAKQQR